MGSVAEWLREIIAIIKELYIIWEEMRCEFFEELENKEE